MSRFTPGQKQFMQEAIRLARRGRNRVSPNPMVGALVVRKGRICGRGYHASFGGAHAEAVALGRAGSGARGGDLFVSLEPCAHRGKTPPCTDAILRAGISRLFYAAADPNPLTAGKGPGILRSAGVSVSGGLLEEEARDLNRSYFHWRETGRPWVILKWAMTLDGKIATRSGQSRWITGDAARARVHQLRRRVDAVLVGTRTLLKDNSLLLPRPSLGRVPFRIVLDRRGRLPLSLKILQDGSPDSGAGGSAARESRLARERRIYVVSRRVTARRKRLAEERGLQVLVVPEGRGGLSLSRVLQGLGSRGISQVLVEGGGELAGSLLDSHLAQEAYIFVAPLMFGGLNAPGPAGGRGFGRILEALRLDSPAMERLGRDVLIHGRLGKNS